MKRPIFFVDGFNMYHALDEAPAFHKYKWLDLTDPERPCRCVSTLPHNAPREAGTSLVMLSSVKALSLPLYDIGKVRPVLYFKGTDIAHGIFEPFDPRKRADGLIHGRKVVPILHGEIDASLCTLKARFLQLLIDLLIGSIVGLPHNFS